MLTPTWAIAQAKMSVEINGTYVPFKSVPDALPRFVRPALFSTGHEVWELQFFGSSFLGKYRDWHFGLATAHQTNTGKGAPEASKFVVVVEADGKRLAIPPSDLHVPRIEGDENQSLTDLIFFDYGVLDQRYRANHLDLTKAYWSDDGGVNDYSFLIGFPTSSKTIKIDDDFTVLSEFTMRWIRQDLQRASTAPLDPEHRNIFVKHERSTRLSVEPDGLSGSPVFSIVSSPSSERYLKFEGIVTNARGDRFAVYPSVYIRDMLDDIISKAQAARSSQHSTQNDARRSA